MEGREKGGRGVGGREGRDEERTMSGAADERGKLYERWLESTSFIIMLNNVARKD